MSTRFNDCRVAILQIVALLLASPAAGSRLPPPPVQPTRYTSPSGEFELFVNPSDLYGRGEAAYRLTRRPGQQVWAGSKPYTLYDAAVANDGTVAGYAYTAGIEGFPKQRQEKFDHGVFHLVIIDSTGRERLNDATRRQGSRFMHSCPDPVAQGIILDADDDRVAFRIHDPDVNRHREEWRVYQLSTGKPLASFEPKGLMEHPEPARFMIDARPVAGTPLTLVHWWRAEFHRGRPSDLGARFTLVNAEGRSVWSFELPNDYNVPDNEDLEDRLTDWIRRRGAILSTNAPERFDLYFVANSQRVSFAVRRDDSAKDGWSVVEAGRVAYRDAALERATSTAPVPKNAVLDAIPERTLKYLGEIKLEIGSSTESPVSGVSDFDFDDQGRVGFIRLEPDNRTTFVLVEQDGTLLQELPIKQTWDWKKTSKPAAVWIDKDRWLVHASQYGIETKAMAFWLDLRDKSLVPIPDFDCPPIKSVAALGNGDFVALGTHRYKYTMADELIGFDRSGRRRWSVGENYDDTKSLFSPDAVAVTSDGHVAVVDVIRHVVQLFDLKRL